jgi:uncharacterized protein
MFYILLIIILISVLYTKYKQIITTYGGVSETFNSFSYINDKGLVIEKKLYNKYSLGTGESETPYHIIGGALSSVSNNDIGVEVTAGSIININKVDSGEFDFAICQEDLLYDNVLGLNKKKIKKKNIRFVTGLYDELYFLIVKQNEGISSFQGLKNGFSGIGRNYIIGTGNSGSGSLANLKLLCETFTINLLRYNKTGINDENKNGNLYYIDEDINVNFNLFIKGEIDALFYVNGPKMTYIYNMSQLVAIKFVPLDGDAFNLFNQITGNNTKERYIKMDENSADNVDKKDIGTQAIRSILICNNKLPDEVVYDFVKSIYKNIDYLKNYMGRQYKDGTDNSYYNALIPLEMFYINKHIKIHPGSYKFYNEIGYINIDGNKDCKYDIDKSTCNLVPGLDKKNVYWKYKSILATEILNG